MLLTASLLECRADSTNGYVDNFVVYMGKPDDGPTKNLGYKVVMEVCRDILGKGYHVYCDNYFTSVHLAADLLEHGTNLIGTTRPSRRNFPKETKQGCHSWALVVCDILIFHITI